VNCKATRANNGNFTLIDQILVNNISLCSNSGSIIDDISDHWPTFVQLINKKTKNKTPAHRRRLMNTTNLTNFRNSLKSLSWNDVLESENVDECYDIFWDYFSNLYDLHFPLVKTRFNRNHHKISEFMTQGLITSRRTKLNLLKINVVTPCDENKQKYKHYRNLFNN
jgi:hypothetical protein